MSWKDRLTYAGAVVTATGAVVALVVSYRKQRDAEEGRFAAQFAAAAAQLGDAAPAVRIAGVYALAALADRHHEQRQQIIDALCGYLRLPYDPSAGRGHLRERSVHRPEGGSELTDVHAYRPADREVRLTIIRVIRDHLRNPGAHTSWCGRDFDFTGAVLDGGDFDHAVFSGGTVSFNGAVFSGGRVSFNGAVFSGGRVSFDGAVFSGGEVSFPLAKFSGGWVFFNQAKFSGGEVSFSLAKFSGGEVSFGGAVFSGGEVSFFRAVFSGGEVPFFRAVFSGGEVSFDQAEFSGGTVSFDQAEFSGGEVTRDKKPFRGWPTPPGQ
ncbi:pentapeptide repeat-containing protein [Arsenicicoccus bolidensis]|uniref:Pentapeptide repeat-containing protein n=1 Tax=Arsenicicoccus bolidensis TaxID=229480 RepID=A0ABS9Q0U7_9MICO|nr:pentapeptide repeat-containing protein [Arsenicicoccus bolidensis]MCG7321495.1 pentapeptide repeat-containing protein [Arsenicicoccus bolidensis]